MGHWTPTGVEPKDYDDEAYIVYVIVGYIHSFQIKIKEF